MKRTFIGRAYPWRVSLGEFSKVVSFGRLSNRESLIENPYPSPTQMALNQDPSAMASLQLATRKLLKKLIWILSKLLGQKREMFTLSERNLEKRSMIYCHRFEPQTLRFANQPLIPNFDRLFRSQWELLTKRLQVATFKQRDSLDGIASTKSFPA